MHFPAILTSETTEKEGRGPSMGAMYDEDEELDFSFLRQSVRQQPRGAAARRRTADDKDRDKMADMISGNRQTAWNPQGQVSALSGRHSREFGSSDRQSRTSGSSGRQSRAFGSSDRQSREYGTSDRHSRASGSSGRHSREFGASGRQNRVSGVSGRHSQITGGPRSKKLQYQTPQADRGRPLTMQEKQRQAAILKKRKRRLHRQKQLLAVLLCILVSGAMFAAYQLRQVGTDIGTEAETGGETMSEVLAEGGDDNVVEGIIQGIPESQFNRHPSWTEDFLTISEYSRPGEPLTEVNNIFVHYTANVNTSAANNRNYFENLKDNHDVPGASAHFIIGIEGEILQIVPMDEIAYAVQSRNEDSISIECCYKYDNGQFTQETYDSLIKLLAWLADTYDLEPGDILRHYDCGGKKCPLYYVDHEDAWRILKQDVADRMLSIQ